MRSDITVTLTAANGLHHYYADTVDPYFEGNGGGNNALSRFAERNPIYRIGPLGAGVGLNYKISNALKLDLGYLSNTANNPEDDNGVFNGNYSGLAQLVFETNRFKVGFTYIHAYDNGGNNAPRFAMGGTGTGLANLNPATLAAATTGGLTQAQLSRPVSSNSYGLEASFQLTPQFVLNGWVGKTDARLIGLGAADIWNFALGLALPDFGKKGNLLGIIAGAEPTLRGLNVPGPENFERDFAYHIEGFYKYQMINNISITPGIIWLTSPNQNRDDDDIIIGTIRTTFTF
ncbi:iron uptake porin [Coleofasciculus sp. FACHB-SPT36]|uniref:iron uptake porin n=1 Tax=Cyanophyceae TaxID=3028117 RepID=UPI0018EF80B4|nr:iron uptake porin [Coleofasciculus sp. FACHB-SPT36]